MFSKIKKFFTGEKSEEAMEMWDTLKDDYDGDPEFHPSLNIDAEYALSLSDEDMNEYLNDIVRRRNEAHSRYIEKRISELE